MVKAAETIDIRRDDPLSAVVAPLMALHMAGVTDGIPAENTHVMGPADLADPSIVFWTAWRGDALAGFVALKALAVDHGEVKSMRTHPDHLRRGVGAALLGHLLAESRARNYARVSLETGTAPRFAAANRLYEAAGFVDGPVFGGYPPSSHNRFMTLAL